MNGTKSVGEPRERQLERLKVEREAVAHAFRALGKVSAVAKRFRISRGKAARLVREAGLTVPPRGRPLEAR